MAGNLTIDSGDTAWMLTSTLLVLMMLQFGLALFYGGLVRAKNLLSVMSQVMGVCAVTILVWVGGGYSLAFSGSGAIVGDLARGRGARGTRSFRPWRARLRPLTVPKLTAIHVPGD